MQYDLTEPCDNCPFRTDKLFYLGVGRAEEIAGSLDRSTFACHKTTRFNDDGEHTPHKKEKHCAGALIMLEKEEQPSQMMRIAERLGMYDMRKLNMDAPVYESREEFIDAQYDAE